MNPIVSTSVISSSDQREKVIILCIKLDRQISSTTDVPEEAYEELDGLSSREEPFKSIFYAENVRMYLVLH